MTIKKQFTLKLPLGKKTVTNPTGHKNSNSLKVIRAFLNRKKIYGNAFSATKAVKETR